MPNRIVISPNAQPIPCEQCGWEALYVAKLISDDGNVVGRMIVCTACRPQPHVHRVRRAA
ncbi:hypothetical protein [Amycolatopsis sp. NPDC051371]|uniref:hypothetical protein n=1 Tax=Amycolatopsis sp. NPDC051371 TaxID=3155800 RepID=UPI00341C2488